MQINNKTRYKTNCEPYRSTKENGDQCLPGRMYVYAKERVISVTAKDRKKATDSIQKISAKSKANNPLMSEPIHLRSTSSRCRL